MKQLLLGIAALLASLLMLFTGTAFAASVIVNGSFETGTAPGLFLTLTAPNTTDIPNWRVDSGTVDYIGTYWTAADGVRSLDMSGDAAGSISQTFATTVGVPYTVTFDLSGNPDGAPALKDVQVNATGGSPQDFTFDTSAMANTDANMMWQPETYTFTASSATTTLSFTSEINSAYGPALDNVAVTAIPLVTVTIDKYIDGKMATAASANSMAFPMSATWNATNIGSGSGTYTLSTSGFNSPNPYEAVTADMTSGASYMTNEITTGNAVVGATCAAGDPYALVGYSWGTSTTTAAAMTATTTVPNFSNLTQNEYVIVWNKNCLPAPILLSPPNGTSTTTAGLTGTSWNAVTDPAGGITYIYQSSNASTTNPDGSFTTPVFTSGPLSATNEPTPGTPAGQYWWHVKATDADGNMSPWSTIWTFTVDNTPAAPPADACNTPSVAPAGFTLRNGTPGSGTYALTPMTMFVGGPGSPKITGPAGNYIICLQAGSPTITLGDGSDTIMTGPGNPNITVGSGGNGSSTITTGSGKSAIKSTDSGDQTVTVGNGSSNITTGSGNDTIKAGAGNSTINAGAGNDSCTVGPGHSTLTSCNP